MDFVKKDREINLKEFILFMCLKWKMYLVVLVSTAAIVGLLNVYGSIKYYPILGAKIILLELVKKVIICAVILIGVIVVIRGLTYLFTDVIKSVEDYNATTAIKCIGVIPTSDDKKISKIDRMLYKCKGVKVERNQKPIYINRICNIIKQMICCDMIKGSTIAIVSSCSSYESGELTELLEGQTSIDNIKIIDAGDVMYSAEAVDRVAEAEYIILAERQGKSKYSEFEQTCKNLESWNKKILGTVLLDVDAL